MDGIKMKCGGEKGGVVCREQAGLVWWYRDTVVGVSPYDWICGVIVD